jgi:L-2-hydroxyglutarate oxidase
MVYPVPDPEFPFLGVHFTRDIYGGLHAGPNAVLALAREGYRRRDIDCWDALEMLSFPGFWRLFGRHWRFGCQELGRSLWKSAFVRALRHLVPEINPADLIPAASGVRAQALDRAGCLVDDFNIIQEAGALHVRNAPSPAATASLAIAQMIVSSWGQA